jgi:hypothetical protein
LHQPSVGLGAGTLSVHAPLRQDDDESLSAGRLSFGDAKALNASAKVRTDRAGLRRRNPLSPVYAGLID